MTCSGNAKKQKTKTVFLVLKLKPTRTSSYSAKKRHICFSSLFLFVFCLFGGGWGRTQIITCFVATNKDNNPFEGRSENNKHPFLFKSKLIMTSFLVNTGTLKKPFRVRNESEDFFGIERKRQVSLYLN